MGEEKEREGGGYIIFYLSIYYVYRTLMSGLLCSSLFGICHYTSISSPTHAPCVLGGKGRYSWEPFLEKARSEELVIKQVS